MSDTNLPATQADAATLPSRLDAISQALAEATTDFERVRVRDTASAVAAAAEVLQRRDIQVQASLLVQDAGRALAQANPPRKGGRPPAKPEADEATEEADTEADAKAKLEAEERQRKLDRLVQDERQAHSKLTDDQYKELRERALRDGEPLTRKRVAAEARRLNQRDSSATQKTQQQRQERPPSGPAQPGQPAETAPEAEPETPAEPEQPAPSATDPEAPAPSERKTFRSFKEYKEHCNSCNDETLAKEFIAKDKVILAFQDKLTDLEEQIAIICESGDSEEMVKKIADLQQQASAYKMQVDEWMRKSNTYQRQLTTANKKLKAAGIDPKMSLKDVQAKHGKK